MRILASRDTRNPFTWILAAAVLVTLGIAIQDLSRTFGETWFNDFDRWMLMTPAFVNGGGYVDDLLPTPPISLLVLVQRAGREVARRRRHIGPFVAALPLIVWFYACWTAGETAGLLAGAE